jgi:ABC-type multidrug transport system ATPase subunit
MQQGKCEMKLLNSSFIVPPDFQYEITQTLELNTNEIIGVFGPNGSGKTTFIKTLSDDVLENKGTLMEVDRKPKIGIIPQDLKNLTPHWLTPQKILNVFKEDLHKRYMYFSQGDYDADVKISRLSGGQRQSFALDLILSFKFDLILLDEPFASLDMGKSIYYANKVKKYCESQKSRAIVILHDPLKLQYLANYFLLFNPHKNVAIVHQNRKILDKESLEAMKFDSEIYTECMHMISEQ